jgi:hypothetical protein
MIQHFYTLTLSSQCKTTHCTYIIDPDIYNFICYTLALEFLDEVFIESVRRGCRVVVASSRGTRPLQLLSSQLRFQPSRLVSFSPQNLLEIICFVCYVAVEEIAQYVTPTSFLQLSDCH